ncbi:MAG: methyltransferase [Pseudomonadota bacterium]
MSRFASRDHAAAFTAARAAEALKLEGRVLVAHDPLPVLAGTLSDLGCAPVVWQRRLAATGRGEHPSPLPPDGIFEHGFYRLPTAWDEFLLSMQQIAAQIAPGGGLIVYGANDEGIKSAARRLPPAFGPAQTCLVKNHCRVIALSPEPMEAPSLKGALAAVQSIVGERTVRFMTLPGLFAHGRLDAGTKLLIETAEALAPPEEGATIIDYGCGGGALLSWAKTAAPSSQRVGIDIDSLAGIALAETDPAARFVLAGRLADGDVPPADLLLSNPPIHAGKAQHFGVVEALLADLDAGLTRAGRALIVVQSTVPLARWTPSGFAATAIASTPSFTVWQLARTR